MLAARLASVLLVLLAASTVGAAGAEAPADALSQLPAHIAVDSRFHVSAQPSADAFMKLPAAGVRTVINLRPAGEAPGLDEKSLVEKAGMKYRALPIAGAADLTRDNVATFDRMLAEEGEGKVLMHCASGNRVGAMMALRARWVQGKSAEEALAIGRSSGLKGLEVDVNTLLQAEEPQADAVSAASPYRPQN
jgi:uncharacterized protein (TIGR01244 family)